MRFSYLEVSPRVWRPIIPIILKSDTSFTPYPALIDSGADFCIFNKELAKLLGISLSAEKVPFVGIGKSMVEGYWGEVQLRIGDEMYPTNVIFADISDFGHGILGQKGFFDHFDVRLSYKRQTIELTPVIN